jgi:hypothetical protein
MIRLFAALFIVTSAPLFKGRSDGCKGGARFVGFYTPKLVPFMWDLLLFTGSTDVGSAPALAVLFTWDLDRNFGIN